MRTRSLSVLTAVLSTGLAMIALRPATALAHCDTLDGPVVAAARQALEQGKVEPALVWIRSSDEAEIRRAFAETLAVRKLGDRARRLADTAFFETLVRVHRAGEGAPYTGLKPAGADHGPAIPAADKALQTGSPEALVHLLQGAVHDGLHGRYVKAVETRRAVKPGDVASGRKAVAAYVDYVHFVERVYGAAHGGAQGTGDTHPPDTGHAAEGGGHHH